MPGSQETQLYTGKIENNVQSKIFHKGKMNIWGLIILSQHYRLAANRIRLVLNMYNWIGPWIIRKLAYHRPIYRYE